MSRTTENRAIEPRRFRQPGGFDPARIGEHSPHLLADPLTTYAGEPIRPSRDRGFGRRIDREIEAGGEPNSSQHPKPVLVESIFWFTDRPKHFLFDIVPTAYKINDSAGDRMLKDAVDREITPKGISLCRTKTDAAGTTAVLVGEVRTERRDLEHPTATRYEHDPETRPDTPSSRKQLEDPIRYRLGGDVDVCGREAEQMVADAPACKVRFVTMLE